MGLRPWMSVSEPTQKTVPALMLYSCARFQMGVPRNHSLVWLLVLVYTKRFPVSGLTMWLAVMPCDSGTRPVTKV